MNTKQIKHYSVVIMTIGILLALFSLSFQDNIYQWSDDGYVTNTTIALVYLINASATLFGLGGTVMYFTIHIIDYLWQCHNCLSHTKRLESFLITNKCLKEWTYNIKSYLNDYNQHGIQYFYKHINAKQYIQFAFAWCETPEGQDFWEDIDKKWQNYLKIKTD